MAKLLYQGHGSVRITTASGKTIYIDPYAGEGYDKPADLILVTHQHSDHNQLNLIKNRNPGCTIITEKEALKDGVYQCIDVGFAAVESVKASNKNHNPAECVGYIIDLGGIDGGVTLYISGDTSKTDEMAQLAERRLDYTLLCCDGVYNMDVNEASECAAIIKAAKNIPYHMTPGKLFDRARAEMFKADGRLIIADGEEVELIRN